MSGLVGKWEHGASGDFFIFNADGTFVSNFLRSVGNITGTYSLNGTQVMLVGDAFGMAFDVQVMGDKAQFTYPGGETTWFSKG